MARQLVSEWPGRESEMARQVRAFDWNSTPLGPRERWPSALRTAVELMLASPQPAYIGWGPELISFYNDAYAPLLAGKRQPVLGQPFRSAWPELMDRLEQPLSQTLAGEGRAFEDELFDLPARTDQPLGWFSGSWIPIRDEDGSVAGFLAMFIETTGRMLAERQLRESMEQVERTQSALAANEERLRLATESAQILAWEIDQASGQVRYSSTIARTFGFEPSDTFDQSNLIELVHPDDQTAVAAGMKAARDQKGRYEGEYRARTPGGWLWVATVVVPHFRSDGEIERWIGISQDITRQKQAELRQATLLAELQHRVRNILAMIRSIARRTGESSRSVSEYAQHLEGRISALARTQALLTRDPGTGVDLRNMILEELHSQAPGRERASRLSGRDIQVSPKAAEVLTLALHELTTNSVKYGALGSTTGSLTVRWTRRSEAETDWLTLEWVEAGLELGDKPMRQGFGTELITRRVPYELRGTGEMQFRPDGLVARIRLPLVEGQSVLQTSGRPAEPA